MRVNQRTLHIARPTLTANLLLLAVAFVWGVTFPIIKDGTSNYPVYAFLALRTGIALVALLPFAARVREWPSRRWIGAGVLCGLVLGLGYILQISGLQFIGPGRAAFITGFYGALVTVMLVGLGRMKLSLPLAAAVVLSVAGLSLLFWGDVTPGILLGDALVLAASFAWAAQIVLVGFFRKDLDATAMALVQIAASLAVYLGLSAAMGQLTLLLQPPPNTLAAAVSTGILCVAFAHVAQVWAQRHTLAAVAGLIFCTEPVWGVLASIILTGETFTALALLGCALMLIGMMLPDAAALWEQRRPKTPQESH